MPKRVTISAILLRLESVQSDLSFVISRLDDIHARLCSIDPSFKVSEIRHAFARQVDVERENERENEVVWRLIDRPVE